MKIAETNEGTEWLSVYNSKETQPLQQNKETQIQIPRREEKSEVRHEKGLEAKDKQIAPNPVHTLLLPQGAAANKCYALLNFYIL